ncbi:enoyl-CoA hydratase [Alkalihalobacillus sp. LMS39]|uniref:enoyl-CoA hydratase n=1 Tax=Alkalihalobacillus sp. LMS39 TaxID=2924032 RepID=UPI001FB2FD69|nr:enoyl-CoA hydratase [Alkalihalobacillus sp. LMS39]UOE93377.1 enoyl-CoA hydratase [Alkalihalobacillus sp. LMS39]
MGHFIVTYNNAVATITFNRPPANALSSEVLSELAKVLDEVEQHDGAKVILLHGQGRFFAAGADIKEFTSVPSGSEFAELAKSGQQLFNRIEAFPKPIIAAVHGAALGGGLELVMACHIRLATKDVKLGLPELQLGLIPGYAGTQRLPRIVGKAKALEMLLTSDPITGEEALSYGLVNSIYDDEQSLMDAASQLAHKIAQKSAVSMKLLLESFSYVTDENFATGVEKEAELFGKAFDSYDGKEGIQAFIEKRKPEFKNK